MKFLVSGTKLKRAVVQMKGESGESRTDAVVALYLTIYQRILDQPISVLPIGRTDWGMVHWIFLPSCPTEEEPDVWIDSCGHGYTCGDLYLRKSPEIYLPKCAYLVNSRVFPVLARLD